MSKKKTLICSLSWTLGGIGALLFIVLMALSFNDLQNDEWGLLYHPYQCILEEETFTEGKYYSIDPAAYFFIFNSKIISLQFGDNSTIGTLTTGGDGNSVTSDTDTGGSITCVSRDGLEIVIQATVSYTLENVKDKLFQFFLTYSIDYEFQVVYFIREALMNACEKHPAAAFYYERSSTEQTMSQKVRSALEVIGLKMETLQLSNIDLPSQFSSAIAAKEVARTAIEAAKNARAQAVTQAATAVSQSQLQADLDIRLALQDAAAILEAARAEAQSLKLQIDADAAALEEIRSSLNLSGAGLLNYLAIEELSSSSDVQIAVESPAIFGA